MDVLLQYMKKKGLNIRFLLYWKAQMMLSKICSRIVLSTITAAFIFPCAQLSPPFFSSLAGEREDISPSITFTSNLTSCQMTPPEHQVCSMLFFVCSLPVFLRAALWYSQQVANLAAQKQQLNVLKHISCFKWGFVGKQIQIKHSLFHSGYSKM